jgi:hypothetical protein
MARISEAALREVRDRLERYLDEVTTAALRPTTEKTYRMGAEQFVRWLDHQFTPGERTKP